MDLFSSVNEDSSYKPLACAAEDVGNADPQALILENGVGVIGADYRGHIILPVVSLSGEFEIKRGMRIAQGIFQKYLTIDDDTIGVGEVRRERFGSTGDF